MTWLEMIEYNSSSSSIPRKIERYFLHGLALGTIPLVLMIFSSLTYYAYFPSHLLGISMTTAILYGIVFILLGGINQSMTKRFWGIESESNIGNGMRDGFILFVLLNIAYSPLMLVMTRVSLDLSWMTITPLHVFLILLLSTPVYLILFGFIGEKTALFLYVDKDPVMPSDYQERSFRCPHCGSSYYYTLDKVSEGQVECQNCAMQFSIR
jgi:hypothetical protein